MHDRTQRQATEGKANRQAARERGIIPVIPRVWLDAIVPRSNSFQSVCTCTAGPPCPWACAAGAAAGSPRPPAPSAPPAAGPQPKSGSRSSSSWPHRLNSWASGDPGRFTGRVEGGRGQECVGWHSADVPLSGFSVRLGRIVGATAGISTGLIEEKLRSGSLSRQPRNLRARPTWR